MSTRTNSIYNWYCEMCNWKHQKKNADDVYTKQICICRDEVEKRLFDYLTSGEFTLDPDIGATLPTKLEDIELGQWDCKTSPTGHCVYNRRDGFALDFCIFCGGPDERK